MIFSVIFIILVIKFMYVGFLSFFMYMRASWIHGAADIQ